MPDAYSRANGERLDFAKISERLRQTRREWLPKLFPNGRIKGGMFNLGDADGAPGDSFPIPLDGSKAKTLEDFGGGFKGDDLDLFTRATRQTPVDAARDAAARFGLDHRTAKPSNRAKPKGSPRPNELEPFPDGRPIPNHPQLGKPDGVWLYRRPADGRPILAHYRFDQRDAGGALIRNDRGKIKKEFRPLIWRGGQFLWEWPDVRPLYGFPELTARPGADVLVVEGERTADAARTLFPDLVVVTWPQGTSGTTKADWAPLSGRRVTILPDADAPGAKAADAVAELATKAGASSVRIVTLPDGLPDGWDVADPLPDGWTDDTLKALVREAPEPKTKPNASPKVKKDWYQRCLTTPQGEVVPNLANIMLALREESIWKGVFAYNEMERTTFINKMFKNHDGSEAVKGPFPRELTDLDITAVQEYLQIVGFPKLGKDVVFQSVEYFASECSFHPVKEYLEGLSWDGVPRLAGGVTVDGEIIEPWLKTYLGAERNDYVANIGRWFFIAMVARVLNPGCKSDYMLILEGGQGIMKSTICGIIGGKYFSDNLPENVSSKDTALHLKGKWLIELAELHTLTKAESTALKAFITRTVEVYRPSYGRLEVKEPRQCLFIGTTNKDTYLKDETGGRRFWPVKVGVVSELDPDGLKADRDQLFAEAVHRYKAGEQWWPNRNFEAQYIKPEQEARFEFDAWETAISDYVSDKDRVTVLEVAQTGIGMMTAKIGTADQRRITAILERLGWERGKKDRVGNRWWVRV